MADELNVDSLIHRLLEGKVQLITFILLYCDPTPLTVS